ncbi:MAG: hypothetical protein PF495_12720 [Spirochaetales bacterium]|jgi:hypothetical protein|nr:hypothetical protein [Spirochaetales bacterium]
MSNCLTITLMKFTPKDGSSETVGFIAGDSYAKTFEDTCPSWDEFFELYPDKQSLIDQVLSLDGFMDIDPNDELVSTHIEVDGWPGEVEKFQSRCF